MCPAAKRPVYLNHWPAAELGDGCEPVVWEQADKYSPWQGQTAENDRDAPVSPIDALNGEGSASNVHDHDLATNHNGQDRNQEVIAEESDKNVKLVVQSSVVEHVEDLEPDESVENNRADLAAIAFNVENHGSGVVENECDDELIDGLSNDHLPHNDADQWCCTLGRLPVEDLFGRWVRCKSKRCH